MTLNFGQRRYQREETASSPLRVSRIFGLLFANLYLFRCNCNLRLEYRFEEIIAFFLVLSYFLIHL